ncbi:MAG: XRE family transcriptional regulator [Chitinophagaceae bacterium]|nr:MAG: XRE family transcriptional regulator [Chitinophagaceae bacterium]
MKYRKQLQVLNGVTAVRISLGFSQLQFGMYIGVSKSMVSGVERGKRHFNFKILQRIFDLEQTVSFNRELTIKLVTEEYGLSLEQLKSHERLQSTTKQYFEYTLKKMVETYQDTMAALQQVEAMLQAPNPSETQFSHGALEASRTRLVKRLKANNGIEQAKIVAKIATAEIMSNAYNAAVQQETAIASATSSTQGIFASTPEEVTSAPGGLAASPITVNAVASVISPSLNLPAPLQPVLATPSPARQLLDMLKDGSGEGVMEKAA